MRRHSLVLTGLVFILLMLGCNHRAAITTLSPSRQQNRAIVQVGDKAEYSINSSATNPLNNKDTIQVTGHRTYSVVASADHGRSVPSFITRTFDFQEDTEERAGSIGKSRTVVTWFGQDAPGNLYMLGVSEDGVKWSFVTDANLAVYMPFQLQEGCSWQYVTHFDDGKTLSVSQKCVGMERLRTPAGDFDAYKVSANTTWDGISYSGYTYISTNLPLIFELKEEAAFDSPVRGLQTNMSQVYMLENLSLVQ